MNAASFAGKLLTEIFASSRSCIRIVLIKMEREVLEEQFCY